MGVTTVGSGSERTGAARSGRNRQGLRWAALVIAIALVATGCESVPPSQPPGETPGPTPGGSIALVVAAVEIAPAGVLLTASGQTKALTAVAKAADGTVIPATVAWESSDGTVASVDASGTVTATAPLGTATITATVAGVESEPAYVTVATPVDDAILLTDDQIVSDPVAVDPDAEPAPDNPYEVVLRGVDGLEPGAILINTESKAVAGEVVSTTPEGADTRVRIVVVPPGELFDAVEFSDTVDLAEGPFEIPAELADAYDVVQDGSTFTFTPKSGTASAGTVDLAGWVGPVMTAGPVPLGVAQGTVALPPLPPFGECKAEAGFGSGLPVPLKLSAPPSFTVNATGTATRQVTSAGTRIAVQATPTMTLEAALEIKSAFEAKLECKATLVRRTFRVPGWAGLFFGGDVEFGVGFEVGGKVTLVSAKVGGKAELRPTIEASIDCPTGGDCTLGGNTSSTTKLEPVLEAPSLNQARFEPAVNLFGFVALEAGNADIDALQFKAIEAKAGAELGAVLTLEGLQIDNEDAEAGRAKYALAFKGEVGPGVKVGEFLDYLGIETVDLLKLQFELPLGESPTGTAKADRPRYLPGDTGTVTVELAADSTVFPSSIGAYNVARVVVARRTGLTTEVLGSVDATEGQTSFEVPITATGLVDADELFAFVVTKLLPLDPPKLEVAKASWTCEVPGPISIRSINDDPDKIYVVFDGANSCRLVAEVGDGFPGAGARDVMLSIDTDGNEAGYDGEDSDSDNDGQNWTALSGYAQNIAPGRHTFRSRRVESGVVYEIKVTVQIEFINGGPNTRMTVQNVVIRLAP